MRTVLMISYGFPPAAYVGGYRTLKYCKYLEDHGWHPVVLTIDARRVAVRDDTLLDGLPGRVEVVRTRDVDPAKWRLPFKRNSSSHRTPPARVDQVVMPGGRSSTPGRRRGGAMLGALRRAVLASPDSHWPWVPFVLARGAQILRSREVDVIYSSSPPHSSHVAASLLARAFRKPHVVDFRDPWFVNGSKRRVDGSSGLMGLQTRLKRFVVVRSARIVTVSDGERDDLHAEFPELDSRRFAVITNGYDPDDFAGISPDAADPSHLTLTHVGTLYPEVGREFFEAVEQLLRERPELGDALRVNLVGVSAPEYRPSIHRLSERGVARDFGFLPHRSALVVAMGSDVLLTLVGGRLFLPSHVPSKLFEYLFIGKPILAVAPPGNLTAILERSGLGVCVPPGDAGRLAETIEILLEAKKTSRSCREPAWEYIRRFERRALTRELASVLEHARALDVPAHWN